VRGIGRERFAGNLAEALGAFGYAVERSESAEPPESWVVGRLARMNPAIPDSAKELRFRLTPTSGGAAVAWVGPTEVPQGDRSRLDRMVRELASALERAVLTESHATARVTRSPDVRLPWENGRPPEGGAAPTQAL
jgi:hypothetical protein